MLLPGNGTFYVPLSYRKLGQGPNTVLKCENSHTKNVSRGLMINSKRKNAFSLYSAAVVMLAASQGAFAHTRLEIPVVVEGTFNATTHAQSGRVLNQVVISHGCPGVAPSTVRLPTYGTSVVFPNAVQYTPVIVVDQGAGPQYTSNQNAGSYYSPLAGIGQIIRTGGPWVTNNNKADNQGNVDGFWGGGDIL